MNAEYNTSGKPVLMINTSRMCNNLAVMVAKAARSNTLLRPHVKTIHLPEIAEVLKLQGINAITVSNAKMALDFARAGWNDILLAFPLNPHNKLIYQRLIEMLPAGNMHFILESVEMAKWLNGIYSGPISVWIKLDTGQGRVGIPAEDLEAITTLHSAMVRMPNLQCRGLLAHFGQLYAMRDRGEKDSEIARATQLMVMAKAAISGNEPVLLSAGDTPSASILDDFSPFEEFRPGNFLYYDLMQWQAGHCRLHDIAVKVVCPVVSHYPKRNQTIIHGGAVHFAKDYIEYPEGQKCYGLIFEKTAFGNQPEISGSLVSLSQEHGMITWNNPETSCKPGDALSVIPVHSCHTAYQLTDSWRFES